MRNIKRPPSSNSDSEYKFKYIYLVLILAFILLVFLTYFLPTCLPDFFADDAWLLEVDENGEKVIKYITASTPMIILSLIREISVTGLVGVILYAFYEHRFEKEEKESLFQSVDAVLSKSVEEHTVKAFLESEVVFKQAFSHEFTKTVLKNCLLKETNGNVDKADAIIQTILGNVINKCSTIRDLDVGMVLEDFVDKSHRYSRYDSYKMIYSIRYKVVLDADKFKFLITNNRKVQNDHLSVFALCMYVDSAFSGKEVFFSVKEVTVDDERLSLSKNRKTNRNYVCEEYSDSALTAKKGTEVQVAYRVEFLLRKNSNYYSYFTPALTKGIHLKFEATSADIKRVRAVPYFNSGHQPNISEDRNSPTSAELTLNDWVLPLSGAALIWQFEGRDINEV